MRNTRADQLSASGGVGRLTEREREVLRLLMRGHDVKSIARELSISTSAVNERLRSARLKLGVTSSREAARMLSAHEGPHEFPVDTQTGVAVGRRPADHRRTSTAMGAGMAIVGVAAAAAMAVAVGRGGHSDAPSGSPRVVATNPASGAVVAAGPLVLSVTFDQRMRPGNYSFVQKDPAIYPDCGKNVPAQSADGRTFTLHCTVKPGHSYEIWFNSEPYLNFKSVDGVAATPFQLRFRTKDR